MALKVNLSGVKTFFFERGEKIGMIACAAAAAVLVGYGVMNGMGAGTSYPAAIKAESERLKRMLAEGQPVQPMPPFVAGNGEYAEKRPDFNWGELFPIENSNNTKRINPRALSARVDPDKKQVQMDYIRGSYFAYEINKPKGTATVVKDAKGPGNGKGGFGQVAPKGGALVPVKIAQPKRMLVVSAVFPLGDQLEEFRKAFRMSNQGELFASKDLPRFLGINVMKCEMTPGKDPVWTPLVFSSFDNKTQSEKLEVDPALMDTLREAEFDDQLAAVNAPFAFQGLVMPLPKLATLPLYQTYPKAELEGIDFVWEALGDGVNAPAVGGVMPKPGVRPGMDKNMGGPRPGMANAAPGMNAGSDVEFDSKVTFGKLVPELTDKFNDRFYVLDPMGTLPDPEEGKGVANPNQPMPFPNPRGGQGFGGVQAGQSPFAATAQWGKYPTALQAGNVAVPGQRPEQGNQANAAANLKPYEALIRFVDVDVKPGKSYKYTIQVRIANPNYKKTELVAFAALAEVKELPPAPAVETPIQTIPEEYFVYAIDQKPDNPKIINGSDTADIKNDQVAVQIHRWADRTADRDSGADYVIGDWVIAERLLLRRGDPIGRTTAIEIPIWDKKSQTHELGLSMIGAQALPPPVRGKGAMQLPPKKFGMQPAPKKDAAGGAELGSVGVPVDFSESTPPAVLVDFNGGKETVKFAGKNLTDDSASTLLILNADGKLIVRNTRLDSDADSAEYKIRQARIDDWKAKVIPYRAAVGPANTPPARPADNPFMKKGGGG